MSVLSLATSKQILTTKPRIAEPISDAARQLILAVMQQDATVAKITNLATTDPAFALRVISYANNPQFGPGQRVESIQQAAKLLGVSALRSIALSLIVSQQASGLDGIEPIWINCLRRAIAARAIALRVDFPKPDLCLAVGLFLDAGALVSARQDPRTAVVVSTSPALHRLVRERVAGFAPHPEIGAAIAREYSLDDDFVAAIQRHHDSGCPRSPLGQIAWAAERVAGVFEGGCFAPAHASAEDALGYVGLRARELEALLRTIPTAVTELAKVLEKPIEPQLEFEALHAQTEANLTALTRQYEALVTSLESVVRAKDSLECELRDSHGRIEKLSSTDPLTGVLNRTAIAAALTCDLARADRDSTHLSVALIDIDHFASINDSWGHSVGDSVLTMVGKVLLDTLRLGDVVGRLDSDEFVCILPDTDSDDAAVVAEKLRLALQQNAIAGPKGPISITASIGLSTIRGPGCRTARDALLTHAAQCQFRAKQQGRDCVVYDRSA